MRIRCNYHGWLYDADGKTLEQPFEDVANPEAHYRDKVRIKAYPVEEKAGLLWPTSARSRAARTELGALPLEERLRPDRALGDPV